MAHLDVRVEVDSGLVGSETVSIASQRQRSLHESRTWELGGLANGGRGETSFAPVGGRGGGDAFVIEVKL